MACRMKFKFPNPTYEVSNKRPSDGSLMYLLFFFKLYAFPHVGPATWFAHLLSYFVFDPPDL